MTEENVRQICRMPSIGEDAPPFKAVTTQGPLHFPEDYKGKWVILFSHPADFTPVCTTEFMTFQKILPELQAMNTEVIGLSIDSIHSHVAWLETIKEKIEFKDMKNQDITFPLIADIKMEIAKQYGMLQPSASTTAAVRAVFVIDHNSKIRAILYYPQSTGRNFQEIKRIVTALQTADGFSVATPADWQVGDDVIIPAPSTMKGIKERKSNKDSDTKVVDWFLTFKKLSADECKKKLSENKAKK
jgi:peroxiredoxin (alkyl hydroperoxide reductase subunit C)